MLLVEPLTVPVLKTVWNILKVLLYECSMRVTKLQTVVLVAVVKELLFNQRDSMCYPPESDSHK